MKTSELTGALLDYWVAKAEGKNHLCVAYEIHGHMGSYSPCQNWEDGGPIIEREGIQLSVAHYFSDPGGAGFTWFAETWTNPPAKGCAPDKPLVAAMRAYVAGKFGDEVEDLPIKG